MIIKFGGLAPNDTLVDLSLVVWYGMAIRTCMRQKFWQILIELAEFNC